MIPIGSGRGRREGAGGLEGTAARARGPAWRRITVLRDAIRRLVEASPWLGRIFGERPDIQLPAFGVSVLTHIVLLLSLGLVTYAALPPSGPKEFRTEVIDTSLNDFDKLDTVEMVETDKQTTIQPVAGSFSPNPSAMIVESPLPPQEQKADLSRPQIAMAAAAVVIPTNTKLDQAVSIKGNGSEHVGDVEGAVDRLAVEIIRQMEKGRTLVVWAFDASGSLPGRARAARQAHRGRLWPHRRARQGRERRQGRPADPGRRLRQGPEG